MSFSNLLKIAMIFLSLSLHATEGAKCINQDQSINMCKGHGFCTMYPIGKDGEACGGSWTIPENWKAMKTDCLKNMEEKKTYSCLNGGIVKSVICGKSNCYTCICS